MPVLSINQAVDVHSHPPGAERGDGAIQGYEHVHTFNNLIPACEFAVSLDKEGHLNINLYTDSGSALDIGEARRLVEIWESGKVSLDAEEIEF
jgi:hypothetical protein